ncbi:unnamed protein product, partial [Mesorhabditis spiculigera]
MFVLDTTQPEMSPETNLQIYTIMEYASGMMEKYESSATAPYLLFPVPGGYPLGWMSHVGISTQLQLVLVGLVGTEMGVVMITLFMTRQQAIMPDSHPLKWSSRTGHALLIAGHLVLYLHISGMLLYMLAHDDQSAAKKIYQEAVQTVRHFQKYPFFRRFFDIESLYVFDPDIGGIIIVNLVVLFFIFLAMILGFLPITLGITGLHGFCTTLVTMFIYRPYSEYIKESAMGVLEFFAPEIPMIGKT